MEGRYKPSVMITTYSSSNADNEIHSFAQPSATKSDRSTRLFSDRCPYRGRAKILLNLSQIKGPTGSIRGHKDVVKKSLENIEVAPVPSRRLFYNLSSQLSSLTSDSSAGETLSEIDQNYRSEFVEHMLREEQDRCIVYTTSLSVIRRTFEDSKRVVSILNLNLIKFEERDIYLNQEYKFQLRLRCNAIVLPAIFVDGRSLGGLKELEILNETGQLKIQLARLGSQNPKAHLCQCCGNAKFIACQSCHGSRKSTVHHFKFNSVALRCIKCDKNDGLTPCPLCSLDRTPFGSQTHTDANNNNNQDNECQKSYV